MKLAIITGASSGLGREYAEQLTTYFPEIDTVWLIARRADRLQEICGNVSAKCEAVPLDLTKDDDIASLSARLESEKAEVQLLVNCAGCGYLDDVVDTDMKLLTRMIDLNVRGLTAVTRAVVPHICRGGHIINISSIASFCPNPRMTTYSSTKAFVSSFSLGLREELRDRKISVTAVCPGPMATEFLDIGGITGNSEIFTKLPYCDPKKVAAGSMKAANRDHAFYTPKAYYRLYRLVSKIVPRALLVKFVKA